MDSGGETKTVQKFKRAIHICTWTPFLAFASSKASSREELWLWKGRLKYSSGQSHHPVIYICSQFLLIREFDGKTDGKFEFTRELYDVKVEPLTLQSL